MELRLTLLTDLSPLVCMRLRGQAVLLFLFFFSRTETSGVSFTLKLLLA